MARTKEDRADSVKKTRWVESSGNVFKDLGVKNPEVALLKADISIAIERAIERKGITQREAAEIMGIDSVKVSNIVNGRLKGYTLDRLFTYLLRLDVDVYVQMKPKPKRREVAEIRGVHT